MANITVSTVFKLHQKTYEYELELKRQNLGLRANGWVWNSLLDAASQSKLRPRQKTEIEGILTIMMRASVSQPMWQVLANKPSKTLTIQDVCSTFELIEEVIAGWESWGGHTKAHHSTRCRGLLTRYLVSTQFPKAERLSLYYRPKLKLDRVGHSRQLISDIPILDGQERIAPIGALPHRNVRELHERTIAALEAPLEHVARACELTFDRWDALQKLMADLAEAPVDAALLSLGVRDLDRVTTPSWVKELPIEELALVYAHIFAKLRTSDPAKWSRQFPHRTSELNSYFREKVGTTTRRGFSAFHFPLGAPQRELIAELLAIQCHTGWNVNTVLELSTDGMSSMNPPFEIQSYKSRIKKMSNMVIVEKRDVLAVRAMGSILHRLQVMKDVGWLASDEKRLWLNVSSARSGNPSSYVAWGGELRAFQEAHNLPQFSPEQIRVQVLCLRGEKGGVEEMRRAANHMSISTTGRYASQLLLYRKNEAINLEFQRRIEKQFLYSTSIDDPGHLWPIGDGTSCVNPQHPPFEHYLDAGVCGGDQCSSGQGCPNRRIVVNRKRVEEAMRTSNYYASNWNRLLNDNQAAFETYHLPSLVFNRAFVEVLRQGRFRYLVDEIEQRIAKEAF